MVYSIFAHTMFKGINCNVESLALVSEGMVLDLASLVGPGEELPGGDSSQIGHGEDSPGWEPHGEQSSGTVWDDFEIIEGVVVCHPEEEDSRRITFFDVFHC